MEEKNNSFKKHSLKLLKNKYFYVTLLVVVLIIYLTFLFSSSEESKSLLTVELEDELVTSGEVTNLKVRIENLDEYLTGTIRVESDGNLEITHPDDSLLEFELYKNEVIQRVLQVNATTTAFRTDYEITAFIDFDNETISESVILSVQRS